jgi:Family of unknown function (DUF5687)
MFLRFIRLEWKAFVRSQAFGTNMVLKIFLGLAAVFYSIMFLVASAGGYYIIKKSLHQDPLVVVSKFLIYYLLFDLVFRSLLQKLPVINIRPLLTLPIKRSTIVNFALGKSLVSFFNIVHIFAVVPFSIVLLKEGYDPAGVLLWWLGLWLLVYINNMLNVLMSDNDFVFVIFLGILALFAGLQYYSYFDVTLVTGVFFHGLYTTYYMVLLPVAVFAGLWWYAHKFFSKKMYLDTGLKGKHQEAQTQDFTWLNRFGSMSPFLKNDLKLILRNKRSKTTVVMSCLFIFYGLLFYTNSLEVYQGAGWQVFASIFVSGGFLFTFGQFVPSWDSAYYPLMMSQNIPYRQYLASKWWLMVIATAVSAVVCSFYLYFGWHIYLMILSGAVFNIGVNSLLVLFGGAFVKTPIDLASGKQAFGNKQAFNVKTMLISLPKMLVPILLYLLGAKLINQTAGYLFVTGAGLLGLAFRNVAFRAIERIYKAEKYSTIAAYKQKG